MPRRNSRDQGGSVTERLGSKALLKKARKAAKHERAQKAKAESKKPKRASQNSSKPKKEKPPVGKKTTRSKAPGKPKAPRRSPRKISSDKGSKLSSLFKRRPIFKKTISERLKAQSEAVDSLASSTRIYIVAFCALVAMAMILGKSGQLQLRDGDHYQKLAKRQATTSKRIGAKRGRILDRHGKELANTIDVESIYAEPRRIQDKKVVSRKLAAILGIPSRRILKRLSNKRSFVYLKRRASPAIAQAVNELEVVGLGTQREPKRFYGNVGLAAHVLGFTNLEGEGKSGIEYIFDQKLRGRSYELPTLRDARGRRVYSSEFKPRNILKGSDVQLTLDRQIQHDSEEALRETVKKYKAKAGVAVVLEVGSGEVLAMASYPSYNPNNLAGTKGKHRKNRVIGSIFEPGSTLKMVTLAGALEDGIISTSDKVDCEGGRWKVGGRTIKDADHAYDLLTITEILKHSSNICSAKIGIRVGRKSLHGWLKRFGFGTKTGIRLPGEERGLMRPYKKWREIALANIAFGQGISATPLQIAQAAAVIAQDGVRVSPRIVRGVTSATGEFEPAKSSEKVSVLSKKTARSLRDMMVTVTQKGGTAESAAVPGFLVAGKTGTAQKIDPVTRRYSRELYIASFVGFVPADKPEVAVLVLVDEPQGSIYGGVIAGPAFRRIAISALTAREIYPQDPEAQAAFLASYQEPPPRKNALEGLKADLASETDVLAEAEPEKGSAAGLDTALSAEAQRMLGLGSAEQNQGATPPESGKMPDFAGLKLHEVLSRSAKVGCDPEISGTGRVQSQSPKAGAKLRRGQTCQLWLAP